MMLSTLCYPPVYHTSPPLNVCYIIIKQLILMILKKFCPVFPGKLLTLRTVILSYHGLNGKIYFSLLWIKCFHQFVGISGK